MQTSYLLDTSAFRAVAGAKLAALAQNRRLLASPFCFWELLAHLDDDGQFHRVKGNLMKFRHVSVLDDPWMSVERDVVRPDDAVHGRPNDSALIYGMLAALRDSATLTEFYEKHVSDDRDQLREIAGCVARVNDFLSNAEVRFQEYVTKIMSVVRDGQVSLATAEDRHRGTLQVVDAWRIQFGDRFDESKGASERLVRQTYVYSSYVLQLAADCLSRTTGVDRNDFEDAKFCQHLSLDVGMTAVTADAGLHRCLRGTLADLGEVADESFRSELQIAGLADLISAS